MERIVFAISKFVDDPVKPAFLKKRMDEECIAEVTYDSLLPPMPFFLTVRT